MATSQPSDIPEDDLSCPICLEEFDLHNVKRHPYILPCLHTFCNYCLQHVYENNGVLKCSLCRAVHNIKEVDDLLYNYDIIEYCRKKEASDETTENRVEWEQFFLSRRPARWILGSPQQIPQSSVFAGMGEHEEVFVGMATHRSGLIPGMIVPSKQKCYIPWGGEALSKKPYYILDNPGDLTLLWEPSSEGNVPLNALKGGEVEDGNRETLYIARVKIEAATFFGKVHPSHGVCYVPYKGKERAFKEYEVLCSSEYQRRRVSICYPTLPRWVSGSDGHLPRHPICGGYHSEGLFYVGMAKHAGGHIPGMIYPMENKCYIPWGSRSIEKSDYYVLDHPGEHLDWEMSYNGAVPENALKAGRSERGEPLFIGRVEINPHLFLCGKVHPSHKVCYIPYQGSEHAFSSYEVLCAKNFPHGHVKLP